MMYMGSCKLLFSRIQKVKLSVLGISLGVVLLINTADAVKYREIVVHGNERVEEETILSHLQLSPGVDYDDQAMNQAFRRVFGTGFFSDVSFDEANGVLTVNVVENPLVNKVVYEGNSSIDDDLLKKDMQLKPRQGYTLARLKHDTKRIQDLYRLKGHFAATVTPNIIKRDQNRVDVVFVIVEGSKTSVNRINFIGNTHYSASKLEEIIQTKESRWYRLFSNDDNYDSGRLAYDQELLRQFYLNQGYADFRVKSAVAELSQDQKHFYITFTLEEGARYKIENTTVTSQIQKIDASTLNSCLTLSANDWYSAKEVEKTVDNLVEKLGDNGYAFVEIIPNLKKDEEKNTITIDFTVTESPNVYIDRIFIKGNHRTNSDVIRRELMLDEGDAYSTSKVKKSERNLKNLGFFKEVKINKVPADTPDKVNLVVDVEEENSTGALSLSGGFSTSDGPLAGVKIEERNLGGRGQSVYASVQVAKRAQEYQAGFTEPYFLNRPLAAGFDVFRFTSSPQGTAFDTKQTGFNLRMGYLLGQDLYQKWTYTLMKDQISGIAANASQFIREEKKDNIKSAITHQITLDKTDNRIDPSSGYDVTLSNTFAGLGGNVSHLKNVLGARYFYPIYSDWVFMLSASVGAATRVGKRVRIADRFSLGGYSLRGFDFAGVGPRDRTTGESLGGLYYYAATAELLIPIRVFPSDLGLKGALFTDIGSLFGTGFPANQIQESKALRAGSGFGFSVSTPLGPIGVDFAFPIKKSKGDHERKVLIRFGPRF